MRIKLSELRQIVQEELTKHNKDKLKSLIRSACTTSHNYLENVKFDNRKDGATISDVLRVGDEVTALAKWLKGRGEEDAAQVSEIADLLAEIGKSTNPFKRLFQKATGTNEQVAKKIEPLVNKIQKIAHDTWQVVIYSKDYQNFDDDQVNNQRDNYVWAH